MDPAGTTDAAVRPGGAAVVIPRSVRHIVPALLATLAPGLLAAEGARFALVCETTLVCDDAGTCAPTDDAVRFDVTPLSYEAGTSRFEIGYDDTVAEATQDGATGPFSWQAEGVTHLLLPSDSTRMTWIRQGPGGAVTLSFLDCVPEE